MTDDEVWGHLAHGAEMARSRPEVRREGGRVVSVCDECRRKVVLDRRWVHSDDQTPLCTMGMADAVRGVVALVAAATWWPVL